MAAEYVVRQSASAGVVMSRPRPPTNTLTFFGDAKPRMTMSTLYTERIRPVSDTPQPFRGEWRRPQLGRNVDNLRVATAQRDHSDSIRGKLRWQPDDKLDSR